MKNKEMQLTIEANSRTSPAVGEAQVNKEKLKKKNQKRNPKWVKSRR